MPPVMCYICGRDFGSKSIAIHIPNCKKKWENEQMKLPKSERRPVPEEPHEFDRVIKGEIKGEALKEYNDKAFDDFNKKALDECPNCKRTFVPRALQVHLRSCKPKDPSDMRNSSAPGPPRSTKPKKPSPSLEPKKNREEEPSRQDIMAFLRKEKVFDSVEARREVMDFLKQLTVSDE